MSKWLPPGGGGYSGRYVSNSTAKRKPATTVTESAEGKSRVRKAGGTGSKSAMTGRYVSKSRVIAFPKTSGSAGVGRVPPKSRSTATESVKSEGGKKSGERKHD
jgi:hypothetical protein